MQTFVCKLNKDDPPLGYSSLHVNSHLSLFQENGAKWRADDKERGTSPNPSLRSAAHFCAVLSMNRRVWTQRKNYRGNKLVDDRMFRGCCVQRDDSKWETSKLPALLSRQAKDWEKKIKEKSNGKAYLENSQHDSSVDVCGIPAPTVADQLARQRCVTIHFAALGPGACGS